MPLAAVDRDGVVVWENDFASALLGRWVGRNYLNAIAPESRPVLEREFARTILGLTQATDVDAVVVGRDGRRHRVEISAAPITVDGSVLGVFGAVIRGADAPSNPAPAPTNLTPRQSEVLRLLARGYSTEQMQTELHLTRQTIRNHVRSLLQRLGAHSRLEAVVIAHERQLID